MLPGFRFLFITTVMSASVLIFAIGAAALMRSTSEHFATFPPYRGPQQQVFVRPQTEAPIPAIALLRVEPEPERGADPVPSLAPDIAVAIELPEPPAAALVDFETLRQEVMQNQPAAETEAQSEIGPADAHSDQTTNVSSQAVDKTATVAAEARRKIEANKIRLRKLEVARRARVAQLSRRRAAAVARARTTRQTQTQSPALFNPAFGTN